MAGELVGALFTSDPAVLDTATILAVIDPAKMRVAWLKYGSGAWLRGFLLMVWTMLSLLRASGSASSATRSCLALTMPHLLLVTW